MRHRVWRDSAFVTPTRTPRRWPWVAGAIVAVLSLLALAQHWDDKAEQEARLLQQVDREVQRLSDFELGRARGHAEMVESARAAWAAAQAEADRCRMKGGAL